MQLAATCFATAPFAFLPCVFKLFKMNDLEYNKLLNEIFVKFPSFQVVGDRAIKPGLENMLEIDKALGNPSKRFKTVHVAGTNGKGSTSHFIASALMSLPAHFLRPASEGGQQNSDRLKVGLYTSPHLVDFRERIKVNGEMIPKEWVYDFLMRNNPLFEEIGASFFEITTAMAFTYFADCKVDIAVMECGLGGRLDSTNIITPMLSVITNIGFDHCQYLGNTLPEIASEKAGIIKAGIPVVIGEVGEPAREMNSAAAKKTNCVHIDESRCGLVNEKKCEDVGAGTGMTVKRVFVEKANACSTDIYFAENLNPYNPFADGVFRSFSRNPKMQTEEQLKSVQSLATSLLASVSLSRMDLKGDCQKKNLKTVSMALAVICRTLVEESHNELSERNISDMVSAIENAAQRTGLRGRWETLSTSPLIICDIGHNAHGMKLLMPQVIRTAREHGGRFFICFGIMRDKDLSAEVEYLPKDAHYLYVAASSPRALPASELKEKMSSYGFKGDVVPAATSATPTASTSANSITFVTDSSKPSVSESGDGKISDTIEYIKKTASPEDFIFIGGSSYVVAEVLALQGR